jgi:membrane fusion protein, multidrug efflux system
MIGVQRYIGGAVVLAAGLIITACGGSDRSAAAASDAAAGTPARIINVEVLEVGSEAFAEYVNITGTAEAERAVTLSSEESGVIRALLVQRGQAVRAGQPIARIDDSVLRPQYEQARAEAALARETFERQQRLWEQDRIGTELSYLRARAAAETSAAQERVLAARLECTIVRAPIDGMLDDRFVEVGTLVGPGTPIARVVDASTIKVVGGVPERHALQIRQGGQARVTFDHIADREFAGTTRFVGTALNEQNRTFPVEIALPNTTGLLKPGMVAKIAVRRSTLDEALLVPREAVLRAEDGYIVYVVVDQDGTTVAETRAVTLGAASGGRVVVEHGVQAGDRVVVVGQQQVAGGDVVRIVRVGAEPAQ